MKKTIQFLAAIILLPLCSSGLLAQNRLIDGQEPLRLTGEEWVQLADQDGIIFSYQYSFCNSQPFIFFKAESHSNQSLMLQWDLTISSNQGLLSMPPQEFILAAGKTEIGNCTDGLPQLQVFRQPEVGETIQLGVNLQVTPL